MFFLSKWSRFIKKRRCFDYLSSSKENFYFHTFGLDYRINKNGFVGTMPVAIVEDKNGVVRYISLESFQFKLSFRPKNLFRSFKYRKVLFGKEYSEKGFFHFFAQDYFWVDKKDFAYLPVAIIEDKQRKIRVVKAETIKFTS